MAKKFLDSMRLETTGQVMEALGEILRSSAGSLSAVRAIAQLTGADWKNVEMWSRAETFPARYFLVMWCELVSRGYSVSPALWRQNLPRNKEILLTAVARKLRAAA